MRRHLIPLAWAVTALVGCLLLAWVIVAATGDAAPRSEPVERSTFVDAFGRQCTQVTARDGVALDCDAKPVESRVGGLLNDLGGHP